MTRLVRETSLINSSRAVSRGFSQHEGSA